MNKLETIKVYATHHESAHEPIKSKVWTISEDPDSEGWETDSGCSGYGLPKDKAEYYAKCINEHATLLQRLERYEEALKDVHSYLSQTDQKLTLQRIEKAFKEEQG